MGQVPFPAHPERYREAQARLHVLQEPYREAQARLRVPQEPYREAQARLRVPQERYREAAARLLFRTTEGRLLAQATTGRAALLPGHPDTTVLPGPGTGVPTTPAEAPRLITGPLPTTATGTAHSTEALLHQESDHLPAFPEDRAAGVRYHAAEDKYITQTV